MKKSKRNLDIPLPYNKSSISFFKHLIAGAVGYVGGFTICWLFYRDATFAAIFASIFIPGTIIYNIKSSKKKRLQKVLLQFQSLLESMVVSLQSGSTDLNALQHAYEDMKIMYSPDSDIAKETNLIIKKFANRQSIGEAFTDFGERTGLEDIKLFASVYYSVEGKGDNTRDIVMRTQKILSDKIEIQAEIKTIAAGPTFEINILIIVPVLIVTVMGFMGGDMMSALFTPAGRFVTTICIFIFVGAYFLAKKMTGIKV